MKREKDIRVYSKRWEIAYIEQKEMNIHAFARVSQRILWFQRQKWQKKSFSKRSTCDTR